MVEMRGGVFTSINGDAETPQEFFNQLDEEFNFTLDACATPETAKCDKYYTKQDDALKQEWHGSVWMNPPYGRGIGEWIKKAYDESRTNADIVVCLLPARTDTAWWHDYCMKGEIRFIRGRLYFEGYTKLDRAPFPSVIVIFERDESD